MSQYGDSNGGTHICTVVLTVVIIPAPLVYREVPGLRACRCYIHARARVCVRSAILACQPSLGVSQNFQTFLLREWFSDRGDLRAHRMCVHIIGTLSTEELIGAGERLKKRLVCVRASVCAFP